MERAIKKYIGIWIDRRKAHILDLSITISSDNEYQQTLETIESDVEPKLRLSGGSRSRKTQWGPQDVSVDGKSAARRKNQLKIFFESIMNKILRADRIFLMGPGETKEQLKKAIDENKDLSGRVIMVETVDKMTLKQIAAHVRDFYEIENVKSPT